MLILNIITDLSLMQIIFYIIIWLLPLFIWIYLVRKANGLLKQNGIDKYNIKKYEYNSYSLCFIFLFLLPIINYILLLTFYNYILLLTFYDLEIGIIYKKYNNKSSFFGIKSINGKTFNIKKSLNNFIEKLFDKLFNI